MTQSAKCFHQLRLQNQFLGLGGFLLPILLDLLWYLVRNMASPRGILALHDVF